MRAMSFRRRPSQRHSLHQTTHTQRVSHTWAVTCAPLKTATSKSSGARKFNRLHVFAQDCRGLKTDSRLTELVHAAHWRKAFASCLSETWREQSEEIISDPSGYIFLGAGQEQTSNRRSKGVWAFFSPLMPQERGTGWLSRNAQISSMTCWGLG